VVAALRVGSFGLAAWTAQPLLARGFYALGLTWPPALVGTLAALLALPLYPRLRESHGIEGVAAAGALAITAYAIVLHLLLEREWRRRGARAGFLAKLALVAASAAWPCSALAARIDELGWHALPTLLVVAAATTAITLALAFLLRFDELDALRARVARRLAR
jgi:peptidoglycan biosynthesis protein MviN/MurJ (putative lipid II flippase)